MADKIAEAANELAGLKAYQPEQAWTFDDLVSQIAAVLTKHFEGK